MVFTVSGAHPAFSIDVEFVVFWCVFADPVRRRSREAFLDAFWEPFWSQNAKLTPSKGPRAPQQGKKGHMKKHPKID